MTDFSTITACGECCVHCSKKQDGKCPGCIESDGYVPEWAESGRCRVHACAKDHRAPFCGLCPEFPCEKLPALIFWNPGIVDRMTALRNEYGLKRSVNRMAERITHVLGKDIHSIWLYGSVVLDDFRPGWSDIDLLVLTNTKITETRALQLVGLRQTMTESEPENPYYRCFEGIIADRNEFFSEFFSKLVYWGTSGQRITDRYRQDPFSAYELAEYGQSVYGEDDRSIFPKPSEEALRSAVMRHYETIRRYAVRTDEKLYSCGWLLDIARCIYTLRHHDVIAKTRAGFWALSEHLFPEEAPLKKALEIRQNPVAYKDREDVKQWLKGLGPTVQEYADVLQRELMQCPSRSKA